MGSRCSINHRSRPLFISSIAPLNIPQFLINLYFLSIVLITQAKTSQLSKAGRSNWAKHKNEHKLHHAGGAVVILDCGDNPAVPQSGAF